MNRKLLSVVVWRPDNASHSLTGVEARQADDQLLLSVLVYSGRFDFYSRQRLPHGVCDTIWLSVGEPKIKMVLAELTSLDPRHWVVTVRLDHEEYHFGCEQDYGIAKLVNALSQRLLGGTDDIV